MFQTLAGHRMFGYCMCFGRRGEAFQWLDSTYRTFKKDLYFPKMVLNCFHQRSTPGWLSLGLAKKRYKMLTMLEIQNISQCNCCYSCLSRHFTAGCIIKCKSRNGKFSQESKTLWINQQVLQCWCNSWQLSQEQQEGSYSTAVTQEKKKEKTRLWWRCT